MVKPSEFFLTVRDFFAVLLPGAVATFCLSGFAAKHLFNGVMFPVLTSEIKQWVAFVVCAYLLGHIIAAVGAWLDPVYDAVYRPMAAGSANNQLVNMARDLRGRDLTMLHLHVAEDPGIKHPVNAYQWSRVMLMSAGSGVVPEMERLEADSKFFRGMTVVSVVYCAVALFEVQPWGVLLGAAGAGTSFWGFCRLRLKATETAYRGLIAHRALAAHARKAQ